MHLLSEVAPVPLSSGVEPGRTQERLQQLCHHAMYRYAVLQIACTGVWCCMYRPVLQSADWLGGSVENTTSYTPFKGAYMHYFWSFCDPNTDVLLAKAAELQNIMTDHTTYFYPYDILATDPNPGDTHHISMSLLTGFAVLSILHLRYSALQPEEAILLIVLIAKSCRHFWSFRGLA